MRRCPALQQVAAHRNAFRVANGREVGALGVSRGENSQPPKKRSVMRGPVVAYTSFLSIESKMASRVFSVAQTAA